MFPGIEEGTWTATKIREAREGEKEDLMAKQKAAMGADQDDDEGDDDEDEEGEEVDEAVGGETRPTADGVVVKSPMDGITDEGGVSGATASDTNMLKKEEVPATPGKLKTGDSAAAEGEDGDGEGDDDDDEDMGEDGVYVEDEDDEEGAVWCMKEGKVVDWGCFFALL